MGRVLLLAIVLAAIGVAIAKFFRRATVYASEAGLLYRSGRFERELGPGLHRWFDPFGRTELVRISRLPRVLPQREITVLSRDQFSLRLSLAPIVAIDDPRAVHEATARHANPFGKGAPVIGDPFERVFPLLSEGAAEAVARLTLEEFLADPKAALAPVEPLLAPALPGARLERLALTQIALPPEVRKMFTEVERVRREGLAALEKARAEQAALRALANAARSLAGNPQLARLRTLHAMESARGAKTFVLAGDPVEAAVAAAAEPKG